MTTDGFDAGLSAACREHRTSGAAWERGPAAEHARTCGECRRHDDDVSRPVASLRALAGTPVRDLWPDIVARSTAQHGDVPSHAWFARAAAAFVGLVSMAAALHALEVAARSTPPTASAPPHPTFAALRAPPDHALVANAPEIQLLALLATTAEDRR